MKMNLNFRGERVEIVDRLEIGGVKSRKANDPIDELRRQDLVMREFEIVETAAMLASKPRPMRTIWCRCGHASIESMKLLLTTLSRAHDESLCSTGSPAEGGDSSSRLQ